MATRCRTCGTVGVYWNGTLIKKLSLYKSTTTRRPARPGRGPHQRGHHRVAERAARNLAGRVGHVTIDLSASYAKAVREALPDAVQVADRFHVVALANDMLTQVRQRVIRETQGRRGRKTDPAWANRRRLLTGHERLRPDSFARMWNSLIDTGDAGVQILQAYTVKEELRTLLALSGTFPERHIIRTRLDSFYQHAAAADAPEAQRLATTIEAWWPAIEAGIMTGYSNARSEGYNRLAKHEGRNAFGFRNPVNQRRRIRYACTRQHRRASAVVNTLPGQV